MTKHKQVNKNIHGKPEISSDHDIALTSSQWFGAAFFYLMNMGRKPMQELWTRKYSQRNLWVGYFIKLVFLALILFLAWTYLFDDSLKN